MDGDKMYTKELKLSIVLGQIMISDWTLETMVMSGWSMGTMSSVVGQFEQW